MEAVNPYDFYITPEEYEQAKKNGIRPALLEVRIRSLGWSKQRAMSEPPKKKKDFGEWPKIAAQNGICYSTFRHRVNAWGWDFERAATEPLQDRKEQVKRAHEARRKYPPEIIKKLKENGIRYDTFRFRLRSGWDIEKAATTPTLTRREIGLMTKAKREFRLRIGRR